MVSLQVLCSLALSAQRGKSNNPSFLVHLITRSAMNITKANLAANLESLLSNEWALITQLGNDYKTRFGTGASNASKACGYDNFGHALRQLAGAEEHPKFSNTISAYRRQQYLYTHLVAPYFVNPQGVIKRPGGLIAFWSRIFSYLGPSPIDRLRLCWLCRLFRDSLRVPVWTTFPHSGYTTLNQLVDRINEVATEDPSNAPSVVFISNGLHELDSSRVRCSLTLVGESREGTVLQGGIHIHANFVGLETMTVIPSPSEFGVHLDGCVSFEGREFTIDGGGCDGMMVSSCGQGTLTDCIVTNCGGSGIKVCDGVIHLHGERTEVTRCTAHVDEDLDNEEEGFVFNPHQVWLRETRREQYGLNVVNSFSRIILHAPLTKEFVSRNNGGGRNWGGNGDIQTDAEHAAELAFLVATAARAPETHLSTHLIAPYFVNPQGVIRNLIASWSRIFSYLGPSPIDRLRLRWLCRLFRDSLRVPVLVWTTFPHSGYTTLNQLVDRINEVATEDPSNAPSVVFISNGLHEVESNQSEHGGRYVTVRCSLTLVGESREGTTIHGGFLIKGDKERDHVRLETMTVSHDEVDPAGGVGVHGVDGAKFDLKELSIKYCWSGVIASGTQGTLTDCSVTNCGGSGIGVSVSRVMDDDLYVSSGVIHLRGERTKVMENCTAHPDDLWQPGQDYDGLNAENSPKIILHASLTNASVSLDNLWPGLIETEVYEFGSRYLHLRLH